MAEVVLDFFVVLFSLVFNISMILVFVLRAQERTHAEAKLDPVTNALLIPFSLLWMLNVVNRSDACRLITSSPIIIFLAFDLWYRTITKEKPYHHPEKWPRSLAVYVILYQVGAIMLNGYYQYSYNKSKKAC